MADDGTQLLYLDDSYLFEAFASVVSVSQEALASGEAVTCLVLDRTVFHPQGGGQPSDRGCIEVDGDTVWSVVDVRFDRQHNTVVHHCAAVAPPPDLVGRRVRLVVDAPTRMLHAAIHSAGHLLDTAMRRVGRSDLLPTKGFHGPVGAFVEYAGAVEPAQRPLLVDALQTEIDALVSARSDAATVVALAATQDELAALCGPAAVSAHYPARVVRLGVDDWGCPCGGTHVKQLGDLGRYRVTVGKITKRGDSVRVSYQVK